MRPVFRLPIRRSVNRELEDELAFHLEMRTAELIEAGWSAEAAREEARRQFGDLEDARAYCRQADLRREKKTMRTEYVAEFRQDVSVAVRSLRRAPLFTLVAMLTLALGIGANTAIFSVVRGVLLRPLPFGDPDRLVEIVSTYEGRRFPYTSPANAVDWETRNRSLSGLAVYTAHSAVLTGAGEPEEIEGAEVGPAFFSILRVRPVVGTLDYGAEEAAWRGPNVVILGERLWRRRFGANSGIVGGMVTLDGEGYRVVGVAPMAATYPAGAEFWLPYRSDPATLAASRGAVFLGVIGRLEDGVSPEAADADIRTVARQLEAEYPDVNRGMGAAAVPLRRWIVGSMDRPLLILLGGVGFVLLIACANLANLLLVRGVLREGELAVRSALGASRSRLVRQLVTESVALSVGGAVVGIVAAAIGTRFLVGAAPAGIPRLEAVRIDGAVLGFALALALGTGLVFGLLPARLATRSDLARALREGGRGTGQPGGHRARRLLVTAEVALAVMLLSGAGLLIRSFERLLRVDPGFRTDDVATFALALPDARYPQGDRQAAFVTGLLERLRAVPGVRGADAALGLPLTSFRFNFSMAVAGRARTGDGPSIETRVATADYFATMGILIVAGRGFTAADRAGAPTALVINQTAARQLFPGENPIGKHVTLGWHRASGKLEGDIVGIVGDVRHSLAAPPSPQLYAGYLQWPVSSFRIVLRSDREAASVLADARQVVRDLDPDLAINQAKSLDTVLGESIAEPRFYMLLLTGFAAIAMVLSGIGIYGVTAYLVGQRTREIGIRMALGASRGRVAAMIVREGAAVAGAGLGLGVLGALGMTRLMRSLLFGVTPSDPVTYLAVAGVLTGAALAASWIPARRAARVDPALTMREQ